MTVARAAADAAVRAARQEDDFEKFAEIVLEEAETVLKRTPEMLPVLKEAGVVDSGGQGLVEFLRGAVEVMLGKEIEIEKTPVPDKPVSYRPAEEVNEDIKYGYCTEFIVMVQEPWDDDREQDFKSYISGIGDCVVVVGDEGIVKVHVHTNHPGKAIEKGLSFGELTSMKIDNMREEHQERFRQAGEQKKEKEPRKPYGFIAVSIGDGLNEILRRICWKRLIKSMQIRSLFFRIIKILSWRQHRHSHWWKIRKSLSYRPRRFRREYLLLLDLNQVGMLIQMLRA